MQVVGAARRGINMVGLIILVLALVGIGVGLMTLSQQAGRGGHWFHTGQMAHDLADAGLKQVVYLLARANSASAAQALPLGPQLKTVYDAIVGNGPAPPDGIELLKFPGGGTPPPTIQSWVDRLKKDWPQVDVELSVKLQLRPSEPLWAGSLEGVPAQTGEKRGAIALTARALVKPPSGIAVERRIILEKKYKVINLMPPVLGRFALFTLEAPTADDPNAVKMKYDWNPPLLGSAQVDGNANPLILESKVASPLIGPAPNQLDRNQFIQSITDLKFLDSQGWVYLGGTAAAPWKLRLAHGFGEAGETPMLPGYKPTAPAPFSDATMKNRMVTEYQNAMQANSDSTLVPCRLDFITPAEGFYLTLHGFSTNYEGISLDPPNPLETVDPAFSTGNGPGPAMDFKAEGAGQGETACVRLFGDALKCSPTLVFGPVNRVLMQRARFSASVISAPGGQCRLSPSGTQLLTVNVYKWGQQDGTVANQIVNAAYQNTTTFDTNGTAVKTEPYVEGLNSILAAGGNGNYGLDGCLVQTNVPGTDKTFTSDLFPAFNGFTPAAGLSAAAKAALTNGTLDAKDVYKGALSDGIKAFNAVMDKKYTYMIEAGKFEPMVFDQGKLNVPGAVVVDSQSVLSLKQIREITAGGILINKAGVTITGDIAHGTPAAPAGGGPAPQPEPLTIVAAKGDITIAAGVQNIEAMLISYEGSIKFAGTNDLTITGGIAAKTLDVKGITSGGKKRIKYSELIDPNNAQGRKLLKVFYGGDDFVACVGAAKP